MREQKVIILVDEGPPAGAGETDLPGGLGCDGGQAGVVTVARTRGVRGRRSGDHDEHRQGQGRKNQKDFLHPLLLFVVG